MNWSDMFPKVLPWVRGCPDDMVTEHLREASREFFARTQVWEVETMPVLTSPGQSVYPLDLDDQQERVKITDAWVDRCQYGVYPTKWGRKLRLQHSHQRFVYMDGPLDIVVHPTPEADGKEIVLLMVVKPALLSDEFPDDFAEYVQDVSHGAIRSLSRLPRVEWSNRQQALDYAGTFEARIASVGFQASKGFTNRRQPGPNRFL